MVKKNRKQALAALENHSKRYQVPIPTTLTDFYDSDFMAYHHRFINANIQYTMGEGTFQLVSTPPTWLNKDDDAVNGPQGEWEHAKFFLPIFIAAQGLYVVVDLRTADLQVGWYQESEFAQDEDGYRSGVEQEEESLTEFLLRLTGDAGDGDNVFEAEEYDSYEWNENFADHSPRAFDVDC